MTDSDVEVFVLRTLGGPFPGTRSITADQMSWPLPVELPVPGGGGVYRKRSESDLGPLPVDSRVKRGAEYAWQGALGDEW